jgi:transcriptional regulator with XRE-family HTH domain
MKTRKLPEAGSASEGASEGEGQPVARRELGRRIVQLRKRRRWSQADLAGRLGVTRERVGNWERGEHAPPLEALAALGEVLRAPLDELVFGRRRGRWLTEEERGRLGRLLAELSELLGPIQDGDGTTTRKAFPRP